MFFYGFHGNIYIYILCLKYSLDACTSDHDNLRLYNYLEKGFNFCIEILREFHDNRTF